MSRPNQNNLTIVGAIVAGIFLVSLVSLMWLGEYGFFASLFLALLIALLSGIVIYLGFGGSIGIPDRAGGTGKSSGASAAKTDTSGSESSAPTAPEPEPAPAAAAPQEPPGEDYDGDGVIEGVNEGTRPAGLDSPRDGNADDLKQIKGIGPKLETLCNSLGFWHFDQVAGWSADEVAWVDANLQGFKGRVSRDDWVAQAKVLAAGGETEFSKRVEDGGVY